MKKVIEIVILLVILGMGKSMSSQNVYGISGMIKIPDAFTMESGKCFIGADYFNDYILRNGERINSGVWTGMVNIGFHRRIEIGARVAAFEALKGGDSDPAHDLVKDRFLNAKVVLFFEKKYVPQISIGLQDVVGTRIYNSTYLVVSKSFNSFPIVRHNVVIGYGSDIATQIWEAPEGTVECLYGVFGGISTVISEYGVINIEWDTRDFNIGITAKYKQYVGLNLFITGLKWPGAGLWVRFGL